MMKARKLLAILGFVLAVGAGALALIQQYATGTATGTVQQAIYVSGCNVTTGTCTVSPTGTSFSWAMGNVTEGSVYNATITIKNIANRPINVSLNVSNISVVGGNGVFESKVIVPTKVIEVPANGTANATVTVAINPAEDPGEQYTITLDVVPQ